MNKGSVYPDRVSMDTEEYARLIAQDAVVGELRAQITKLESLLRLETKPGQHPPSSIRGGLGT